MKQVDGKAAHLALISPVFTEQHRGVDKPPSTPEGGR
jgi:hypothetical protein